MLLSAGSLDSYSILPCIGYLKCLTAELIKATTWWGAGVLTRLNSVSTFYLSLEPHFLCHPCLVLFCRRDNLVLSPLSHFTPHAMLKLPNSSRFLHCNSMFQSEGLFYI